MRIPRALVIGYGRMGKLHRKVLRDLGYTVKTIDPDPAAGADYLSYHPSVRDYDVVVIVVPIPYLATEAFDWAGFPGLLMVEKPFATSRSDAVDLAKELYGQKVYVNYLERFNPQARRLKQYLDIHQPEQVSMSFNRTNDRPSSDLRLDLLSHDKDLAQWFGVKGALFHVNAGEHCERKRYIATNLPAPFHRVDLMAHDTSPLHAMWHSALTGGWDCATPADAIEVLRSLE